MLVVRITDEFNSVYSFETNSDKEALKVISDWLRNRDETPIYEIVIEVDE